MPDENDDRFCARRGMRRMEVGLLAVVALATLVAAILG